MTDETLQGLAYMFREILDLADIQIVNVHIADQHFVLTVWQVVASALFFTTMVKNNAEATTCQTVRTKC